MSVIEGWPWDGLDLSPEATEILERFWFQISQRRPFKHDFPDMYEKAREEFDEMFGDIASVIDDVIERQKHKTNLGGEG